MSEVDRPDGSVATPIGWTLIVVGCVGVFVAALADSINELILGVGLANLGFGLGVLLLSLGYLVRAIWFLPGRDIPSPELEIPAIESGQTFCDWCERIPAAGKPCSDFDPDALARISTKVSNPICKHELGHRGYAISGD